MIDHNASVNVKDKNDCTPLMTAATLGHDKIVESLLRNGAKKDAVNKDGNTTLIIATLNGIDSTNSYAFHVQTCLE